MGDEIENTNSVDPNRRIHDLSALQELYREFMGCDDPRIEEEISRARSHLETLISERLEESADAASRTETASILRRSELALPVVPTSYRTLVDMLPDSTRDELKVRHDDAAFILQVRSAVDDIERYVGDRYDLLALSPDELFALREGLTHFINGPTRSQVGAVQDFIIQFPVHEWESWLTHGARSRIRYARNRLADTSTDWNPKQDTVVQLCNDVLSAYHKMVERNMIFHNYAPRNHRENPLARLYVEAYLTHEVLPRRLPILQRVVVDSLNTVLDFDRLIVAPCIEGEIGFDTSRQTNIMRSLVAFYSNRGRLSDKQRELAFSLMNQYLGMISAASYDVHLRMSTRAQELGYSHETALALPRPA